MFGSRGGGTSSGRTHKTSVAADPPEVGIESEHVLEKVIYNKGYYR
jgi:hypothetical protein